MNEKLLKYHYVILGSDWDVYKIAYSSLSTKTDAEYFSNPNQKLNKFLAKIYKFHSSRRINNLFYLPGKSLWNRWLFHFNEYGSKPFCFVIFGRWHDMGDEIGLEAFLRNNYPNCKIVWFVQDLFSLQRSYFRRLPFDPQKEKNKYDLIVSYDRGDCRQYDFEYHPTVFTTVPIDSSSIGEKCDIYFLGKAKNRLTLILKYYTLLSDLGFNCSFYLIGVPESEREIKSGLHYISEPFTYMENLKHVQSCNCVLEIMQDNAVGCTFRTWESLGYKKKLITNNLGIRNEPFFDPNTIYVLDDNFNPDDLSRFIKQEGITYKDNSFMEPMNLLYFIDKKLV